MTELVERVERPVVAADTDSWVTVVAEVAKLAGHIADTDFVPASFRGNPAAATAAILYGREVGLPPMTSLTQIFVQKGRPAMYAEAMRALILAAGHEFEVRAATGREATVAGRRRGTSRWQEVVWNLDMARAAGLIKSGGAWESYPRAMLVAKATAELARQMFADVIHGLVAIEDIDDTVSPDAITAAPEPAAPKTTVKRATRRTGTRKTADHPNTSPVAPTSPSDERGADAQQPELPLPGENEDVSGDTYAPTTGAGSAPPAESGSTSERPPAEVEPTPDTSTVAGLGEVPGTVEEPPPPVDVPGKTVIVGPGHEHPPAVDYVPFDPVDVDTTDDPWAPPTDEPVDAEEQPEPDAPSPDATTQVISEEPADPTLDQPARRVDVVRALMDYDRLGVTDRDHRLAYACALLGRDIESFAQLTRREANMMKQTLGLCKNRDELERVAGATEAQRWEQQMLNDGAS